MTLQSLLRRHLLVFLLGLCQLTLAADLEGALSGVVRIDIEVRGERVQLGSGFAVSKSHVFTNNHVIEAARAASAPVLITQSRAGTETVTARVLARNAQIDLALLKIDADSLSPLTFHLPKPKPDQALLSIGFPGNLSDAANGALVNTPIVSRGTIAQLLPRDVGTPVEHTSIIHHAPTGPGNSGGPVFDGCYRVIGVTVRGFSAPRGGATLYDAIHIQAAYDLALKEGLRPATSDSSCVDERGATWQLGAALAVSSAAFVLALRRPRERIIRIVEKASQEVSGRVTSMVKNSLGKKGDNKNLMLLSGFDNVTGTPLRVPVTLPAATEIPPGALSEFVIGRSAIVAHFTIDDVSLSRRHARIFLREPSQPLVEDLGSASGSRLNGLRLAPFVPVPIRTGDNLMLGELSLTVLAGGGQSKRSS